MSQNFRESSGGGRDPDFDAWQSAKANLDTGFAGVTERSRDTRLLYYQEAI